MSVQDFQYLLNFTDLHSIEDLIFWASEAKKTKNILNKYEDYFFACSVANPKTWQKTARELKKKISVHEITLKGLLTEQVIQEETQESIESAMRWTG